LLGVTFGRTSFGSFIADFPGLVGGCAGGEGTNGGRLEVKAGSGKEEDSMAGLMLK